MIIFSFLDYYLSSLVVEPSFRDDFIGGLLIMIFIMPGKISHYYLQDNNT